MCIIYMCIIIRQAGTSLPSCIYNWHNFVIVITIIHDSLQYICMCTYLVRVTTQTCVVLSGYSI